MNRREFGKISATATLASFLPLSGNAQQTNQHQDHEAAMKQAENLMGGAKLKIAMLAYPGMYLQDLVGPLTMFEALMNRDIHLVWKDKQPVKAGSLVAITPNTTLKDCPDNLDVLFVPGGLPGTQQMMEDDEVLNFLAEKGKTAKYVTSVCTGALVLGAAGLLKGYKATSYWNTLETLKVFGAIPTEGRVVIDRNRMTGGGVTAGLDFGLAIVAKLRNQTYAEAVQLYVEYNPQPPFNSGSPATANKQAKKFIDDMFTPAAKSLHETALKTQQRRG
ncbi:MAG: DJ-1/PfpI family protein [Acidobacteriota bacterium]|nr:DJ-1/PfpI family protein [Acidobacteriota bacterium]